MTEYTDKIRSVEDLAQDIKSMIDWRVARIVEEDASWREKYESFATRLRYEVDEAKRIHQSFQEQGLSANAVEMEGYLRALLIVQSMLEE